MTRLLVSVANFAEAEIAFRANVDLVDLKNPAAGSLGRPAKELKLQAVAAKPSHMVLSCALGEWHEQADLPIPTGFDYLKFGLSHTRHLEWHSIISQLYSCLVNNARPVLVCYVDSDLACAPIVQELIPAGLEAGFRTVLLDTFNKSAGILSTYCDPAQIRNWIELVHEAQGEIAIGGGITLENLPEIAALQPDWVAVRGAICLNGLRTNSLDPQRIATASSLVAAANSARTSVTAYPE